MADALLLRVHAQVQQLKKKNGEGLLPRRAGAVSMGTHMGLDGSVLRCSWCRLYCCFTAALLLLYCCFTAALLHIWGLTAACLDAAGAGFTAALLLLYCCFTAALLHIWGLTAACLDAAGAGFTAALLLLYCCSTAALLLLYCCFTAALLLFYCGISCVTLAARHWQLTLYA
jgi:hypothetical protein